jgi:protease-4
VQAIAPFAEGRIWSGVQGHEHKLVDVLGGLDDAIAQARALGKVDADVPVVVEGAGETLLDLLALDEHAAEEDVRAALLRLRAAPPSVLEVLSPKARPFMAMLQPLLEGEHVLAIVPHGISVQ